MTPTDVIERFAQLLSTGDVGAAVELYEPEAAFAVQPGELAVGRTAIGAALVQFAALRPMLTSDIQEVVDIGDLALVVNRWTLDGRDPDGTPVHLEGRSADVLRRAETGEWRIAIDDPWGGAIGT